MQFRDKPYTSRGRHQRIRTTLYFRSAHRFAATCCRLHQILDHNTPLIYKHLRRQIQCETYARILLADQGTLTCVYPLVTIQDLV